jgi:mycofactocin precursor
MIDPVAQEQAAVEPEEAVEASADELVEDDLLVEDVSIDGMCGVY